MPRSRPSCSRPVVARRLIQCAAGLAGMILLGLALAGRQIAAEDLLDRYAATYRHRAGLPTAIQVADDGRVWYLQSGPRDNEQALYVWEPQTKSARVVVTAAQLLGGGPEELSPEERARRERSRQTGRGIASYEVARDGRRVLVPLGTRWFLGDRESDAWRELPALDPGPIDPQLSPAGDRVAYARGRDLFVLDLATLVETRLTNSPDPAVSFGQAEFIAQEELARSHGAWWSPDGAFLAVQETDEREVELIRPGDPSATDAQPPEMRYPRTGTANARVRLWIVPAGGGDAVRVAWDEARDPYLARVVWEDRCPLTLVVEDRAQRESVVLAADPASGATQTVHVERDEAWLNLDSACPHWLNDGTGFLWSTERRGNWQLERRGRQGELLAVVNDLAAGPARLLDVDEATGTVWVSHSPAPTGSVLATLPLRPTAPATPQAVLPADGEQTAYFARNGTTLVTQVTPRVGRPRWEIRPRQGARLGEPVGHLPLRAETPEAAPGVELVETATEPRLWAALIRPPDFDPRLHYPVLVHVYGGPDSQMVAAAEERYRLALALAEQGFCLVSIDGRGTARRGRDWERSVRHRLTEIPLADTVAALADLGQKFPELDTSRVGIWGWSFGGYLAAMGLLRHPQVFAAGVAGAPVTDWRYYDTHYTERYLGLPHEQPEVYDRNSLLTFAGELQRPLLLVHGRADDNVHFRHSELLVAALREAGRDFEFLPLADQTHVIADPQTTVALYRRIVAFFHQHLGPPRQQP